MVENALRQALAAELSAVAPALAETADTLLDPALPVECLPEVGAQYGEFTRRVALAAEAVALDELRAVMAFIDANLVQYAEADPARRADPALRRLLAGWPEILADCLNDPDPARLRAFLTDPAWLWQPDPAQIDAIVAGLARPSEAETAAEDDAAAGSGAPVLDAADVDLTIPEDVSPKLRDTFHDELPQAVAELGALVRALLGEGASAETLADARRVAHTLKGAANIVGVAGIARLTHQLEEVLEHLLEQQAAPRAALGALLERAMDTLAQMAEAVLGLGEAPADALEVLRALADWRGLVGQDALRPLAAAPAAKPAAAGPAVEAPAPPARPRTAGALLDRLLALTGELASANLLARGQVQAADRSVEAIARVHQALRGLLGALQTQIFQSGLRPAAAEGDAHFDPLELDRYNELHSLANLSAEMLEDLDDLTRRLQRELEGLRDTLNQQEQLDRELDRTIAAERLVPVRDIVPRLERIVRQTARALDKRVELVVQGEGLSLDGALLDGVLDPLLHLLRNAVDHGIEPPEARRAAGKPETGCIELDFGRQGNQIVVRCRDDGRGIDLDAVKRRAAELGLLAPEDIVDEQALYALILQPGFSTRRDATQVSGRGIGMDVVASRVAALRGRLEIHSREGQGSEFVLTLPQTLLRAHVLLVAAAGLRCALITDSFEQIVQVEREAFGADGRRLRFDRRDWTVHSLNRLFGLPEPPPAKRPTVLLLGRGETAAAVLVERALGEGERVLKKPGRHLPRLPGLVGTVITTEGEAVPVFDLAELLDRPLPLIAEYRQRHARDPAESLPEVLIVDDSSSARRMLSQAVRDAGFRVRTAIDGLEAVALIEQRPPDLVLTDLEMPKMNGLELAAHLRRQAPTRALPIVMVTSRATEKHRGQALAAGVDVYLTKPVTVDDLIATLTRALEARGAPPAGALPA